MHSHSPEPADSLAIALPVSAKNASSSVVVLVLSFKLGWCAHGYDFAVVDDGHPVGIFVGFLHVMCGEKNGQALFFIQVLNVSPDVIARLRVKAECWLVKEQNTRVVKQSASNFQSSFHTAGKFLGQAVAPIPEVNQFQKLFDAWFVERFGEAIKHGVEFHIFVGSQLGVDEGS